MPIAPGLHLVRGDVIEMRARVDYTATIGSTVYASLEGGMGSSVRIERESAKIVSTVLAPGDEVRAVEAADMTDHGLDVSTEAWPFGIVVAVRNTKAWIDWPIGPSLEDVTSLRRIRTRQQVEDLEPRPGEEATAAEIEPTPAATAAAAPVDADTLAAYPDAPPSSAPAPVLFTDMPEF